MKAAKRTGAAFLAVLLLAAASWGADIQAMAEKVFTAAMEGKPFPVLTAEYPGMTVDESYAVQTAYSKKRLGGERPVGFKAGLTTEATMKKFGSDTPFAAVLFPGGGMDGSAGPVEVNRAGFGNLMLECEIGFILGAPVKEPLKDVDALKGKVEFLAAAIELPDLAFTDMKQLKAADINASAISSKGFIMGKPVSLGGAPDINELVPVLSLDGAEVNRGKGSDALGNQWETAIWLVNKMLEQGWTMEKGDVLLTGALGNMLPGKPGSYVYDAGALGGIEFTVK